MAKGVKTGGRTKGTPNKRTQEARELAERLGVDPLEILLLMCKRDWEALGYDGPKISVMTATGQVAEIDVITPDLQQKAAKDAMPYLYQRLQATQIDLGSKADQDIQINFISKEPKKEAK